MAHSKGSVSLNSISSREDGKCAAAHIFSLEL